MAQWHPVAKTSEIPLGGAICVEIGERIVALFHLDDGFYALDDECPHAQGPLSEGYVEGDEVECPWHAARFKIRTGKVCSDITDVDASTYPVRVSGDMVEVEV